jgi:hypothetical protein
MGTGRVVGEEVARHARDGGRPWKAYSAGRAVEVFATGLLEGIDGGRGRCNGGITLEWVVKPRRIRGVRFEFLADTVRKTGDFAVSVHYDNL